MFSARHIAIALSESHGAIKKEGEIIGKIEQHENLLAHA
jgi:hypothetical protein